MSFRLCAFKQHCFIHLLKISFVFCQMYAPVSSEIRSNSLSSAVCPHRSQHSTRHHPMFARMPASTCQNFVSLQGRLATASEYFSRYSSERIGVAHLASPVSFVRSSCSSISGLTLTSSRSSWTAIFCVACRSLGWNG